MALVLEAFLIGQNAGYKTTHGIRYSQRRNLTAGQDKIAERYFLVNA